MEKDDYALGDVLTPDSPRRLLFIIGLKIYGGGLGRQRRHNQGARKGIEMRDSWRSKVAKCISGGRRILAKRGV